MEREGWEREQGPRAERVALAGALGGVSGREHLVEVLLRRSGSEDAEGASLPLQVLDVAALGRAVVGRYADRALAAGVDLGYEGPDEGVPVRGDAPLLREALGNLLDNALRYGAVRGMITLSVQRDEDGVQVWGDDDGAGIDAAERGRVTGGEVAGLARPVRCGRMMCGGRLGGTNW